MLNSKSFLFEIGWEVCNRIGGVSAVLSAKAKEAKKYFHENYLVIGPLLARNELFVADSSPFLDSIAKLLAKNNISCRTGYWDVDGRPPVILVSTKNHHDMDQLLYGLWENFGVNSFGSSKEYVNAVLFATIAGEAIQEIVNHLLKDNKNIIAHFHEWRSAAGLLYLKKNVTAVTTLFTAHTTVLGSVLSENNKNIYDLPETFNAEKVAGENKVLPEHTLEAAAAKNADYFTTVSGLVADEAYEMLKTYPDKILINGINLEKIENNLKELQKTKVRTKLLSIASTLTGKTFPDNALIWITSGSYELHNRGYDIFLKSLAQLNKLITGNAPPIIVFFLIAKKYCVKEDSVIEAGRNKNYGILTHRLDDPDKDSIVRLCRQLGLCETDNKINIIYSNACLNGDDGVFDFPYYSILASSDLGVFPSFYESWGYGALESLAYGVPAVTSDLTGFGNWIESLVNIDECANAIFVLKHKNRGEKEVLNSLRNHLQRTIIRTIKQQGCADMNIAAITKLADWRVLYKNYLEAYRQAIEYNKAYCEIIPSENYVTKIQEAITTMPRFHLIEQEIQLPKELTDLEKLANNFWWSWYDDANGLFRDIDEVLWEEVFHNPIKFLKKVSSGALKRKIVDEQYMQKYHQLLKEFNDYLANDKTPELCQTVVNVQHPVAFFCLEYGLHECLPIYSGGLGVLAGDFLKTVSCLNVPMIAIGLFYKEGYFTQHINEKGEQVVVYDVNDPNDLPMQPVMNKSGKPYLQTIEIIDRTVYLQVWEVKVGRVKLYLLDTNIPHNSLQDRQITNRLYVGDRENRFLQEYVLGIGGVKFISNYLKIKPSIYHLNEDHSVFLLFEQIKEFCHQGCSFREAYAAVRCSSIFTTHTSVPAGHEKYSVAMMRKYFTQYAKLMGTTIDELIKLGETAKETPQIFSLSTLAFRLTISANAVSKIHRKVVCDVWSELWPGFLKTEVPVTSITNGVHICTWLGMTLKNLFNKHLRKCWWLYPEEKKTWDRIKNIPNDELWAAHQQQKQELIKNIKERIVTEYAAREYPREFIDDSLNCLEEDALFIGLSRRFASYKRHDLILRSEKNLSKILTNSARPVVLIVAGKAHPTDPLGQELVTKVINIMRKNLFAGHIIFLENYDISLGRLLVQGVDLWLNTPMIYKEACGTSGMKVAINGGLNFSVDDGWWGEINGSEVGWSIKSCDEDTDPAKCYEIENYYLLEVLEHEIIPCYYEKNAQGFSEKWLKKMKKSIAVIAAQYNSCRMAKEYFDKLYCPIANYSKKMMQNHGQELKKLLKWQEKILSRFQTVEIKSVVIGGVKDGQVAADGIVTVKLILLPGNLQPEEIKAELVFVYNEEGEIQATTILPLSLDKSGNKGVLTYVGEFDAKTIRFNAYGVRVYPYNSLLFYPQDVGIVYWE